MSAPACLNSVPPSLTWTGPAWRGRGDAKTRVGRANGHRARSRFGTPETENGDGIRWRAALLRSFPGFVESACAYPFFYPYVRP
jgi:hypothetical protein